MRNRLVCAALLLGLAVSLSGQTSEWKTYRNTTGNLSVMFPVEPQDSVNKSDKEMESHNLMAQTPAGLYLVTYVAMSTPQPVNEATFEVYKNSVFKELPTCAINSEQAAQPSLEGYVGRLYKLTCDMNNTKVVATGNLYWGKRYAYAVLVMYSASVAAPDGAKKFLTSFSVLDSTK